MTCSKAIIIITIVNMIVLAVGMTWSEYYGYTSAKLEMSK